MKEWQKFRVHCPLYAPFYTLQRGQPVPKNSLHCPDILKIVSAMTVDDKANFR